MVGYNFILAGASLVALETGALLWPEKRLLCVSDLHLGKSASIIRRGGPMLPPYDVLDTLLRLESDICSSQAEIIVCLGDNFEDLEKLYVEQINIFGNFITEEKVIRNSLIVD